MIHRRESQSRAAAALLVLLLHLMLAGLFVLSLRLPRTQENRDALQVLILPRDHSGSPEEPPQIKPDLRMPDPPNPDFALETPIVVPVEVTVPQAINPSLNDSASVPLPAPSGEGGRDSSKGAAAGEGDVGASNVRSVWPVYPVAAAVRAQEGSVVVAVTVDSSGRPADARVQQSSGFRLLDQAAVHAFRQWRFPPSTGGEQPREVKLRAGFWLADGPAPRFLHGYVTFNADTVARLNASARHVTLEAANGDTPRRLITSLIEVLAASMYPDASDPHTVRRWPRVYVIVEDGPLHLTGTPPWPRTLDRSPVLNVRLMGLVTFKDLEVDGKSSERRNWYAFAVRQERTTSEWLLEIVPGTGIKSVMVMNGGPSCAAAPGSAACLADPLRGPD